MQSFRVLCRSSSKSRLLLLDRTLCSLNNGNVQRVQDAKDLVLVERQACSRTVILNRPLALNALTTSMGIRLHKLYESWEKDPDVGFVVLKGNGRAFCAGGDVVSLYRLIKEGRIEECKECFRTFYSFMYLLGTYLKPHVAILDGITMGGGAGISVHGSYRIATDRTVFSTPEVLIGLHPDAGASYYLSRLPGYIGEYLALTGDRIGGEEMLAWGLATHYASSASVPLIEEGLSNLMTNDFSVMETFLARYGGRHGIPQGKSVLRRMEMINKCFSHGTIEEIISALETEEARSKDKWCFSTLKKLRGAPPLSLKVSLRSIREGRFQSLEQCLAREYMMSLQVISGKISSDFCEGVRARLVDKCFAPKWNPPCLESVSEDMVNAYFEALDDCEPGLDLPTKLREAFAC
ncbi:ATP-dependent caseinolytic protease/crotonase family protein isoform 1 [Tripterygium wilfordii]|uniref:3-hydroxyisobutyryl-CoA hydrolase n=1 Tax=Tripterygium wilfordii TaxID=458696 RepID=A0A7J7C6S5_TRIWF|nr:ATP-dependent caseinolytic protease/crotonase family protein isoform 1 [Tripterygium wilfordii]